MSRIPNAPALLEPTPEERALSRRLIDLMRAEIAHAGGAIATSTHATTRGAILTSAGR